MWYVKITFSQALTMMKKFYINYVDSKLNKQRKHLQICRCFCFAQIGRLGKIIRKNWDKLLTFEFQNYII